MGKLNAKRSLQVMMTQCDWTCWRTLGIETGKEAWPGGGKNLKYFFDVVCNRKNALLSLLWCVYTGIIYNFGPCVGVYTQATLRLILS